MTTQADPDSHAEAETPLHLPPRIERVAAAIQDESSSRSAAVLGQALAAATGSDLMLIAVEPDLSAIVPFVSWRQEHHATEKMLFRMRAEFAPGALTAIDADLSIPRGIQRLVHRHHRQLLVVASRHEAAEGTVSIGHGARQLLHDLPCALAIAPRGLDARPDFGLRRIGVGFDGGPQSRAALAIAQQIAVGAKAEMIVRGVVDSRVPSLGWAGLWPAVVNESWREVLSEESESLRETIDAAVTGADPAVTVEVVRDVPAASLTEMSADLDLLVIGSRRWGAVARLLLGGTGEALVEGAKCALLIVPSPPASHAG